MKDKKMKTIIIPFAAILMLGLLGCGDDLDAQASLSQESDNQPALEQELDDQLEQELDGQEVLERILESDLLEEQGITINQGQEPFDAGLGDEFDIMFYAISNYGKYFFTPGDWTDELVLSLIEIGEKGTHFAKEWLGSESDEIVNFIYNITEPDDDHFLPIWGGGGSFGDFIYVSVDARHIVSTLIVHEAVHEVLRHNNIMSNFPTPPDTSTWHGALFLEEGFCNVLEVLFLLETGFSYPSSGSGDMTTIDAIHELAIWAFGFFDFEDEEEYGSRYAQLMSYDTAASFVIFLLEHRGSREDFMRFFEDIYLAEAIYGETLDELINSWLVYLDGYR